MILPVKQLVCLLFLVGAVPALAQQPPPGAPPATPPVPPASGTAPTPPGATPPPPPPGAPAVPPGGDLVIGDPNPQTPPQVDVADEVTLNFVEQDLYTLLDFFARTTRRNFVISDKKELEGKKVTVISHHPIPAALAWQAFLSALEASGYTTYDSGGNWYRIVKTQEAGNAPLAVGVGDAVPYTENFVTQLLTPSNVSVSEVSKVIEALKSPEGKIVAYAPTNTLIITDTGANIRKMLRILSELDVAAPKSTIDIIQLKYASASDVKTIIEALYGTTDTTTDTSRTTPSSSRSTPRSSRRPTPTPAPSDDGGAVTAGDESKFIAKVIDDERTNSLIVLANPEGHKAVRDLVAELDKDVDPLNRAQIHVVYLEHAKAADVANVLATLSQNGSRSNQPNRRGGENGTRPNQPNTPGSTRNPQTPVVNGAGAAGGDDETGGAIAAFDSGMRIAPDENTNSLVIIANTEDFAVVEQVIKSLDIERKQVYVDVVILELSSNDTLDFSLAGHLPVQPSDKATGLVGAQLGASSALGLSQDLLNGLALGVFGESIPYTLADGTELQVPIFGIVLNAIKTNSSVNIVSNPAIMTLDNEEAKIVVGRKVPFPTTSGLNNLGQPVVSFQREDVAITLQITPRINSANYVTLETKIEAQEIEESSDSLSAAAANGGPITSNREVDNVVLVRDNQTVVIGGLVGSTDTDVETKVPVLGDLPVIGALFRGTRKTQRKSNLMVFLTPHILDDPDDMLEIQRVKEAQREEFLHRFYGKSRDEYIDAMNELLRYSMNFVDQPSVFRGPDTVSHDLTLDGQPISPETQKALDDAIHDAPQPTEPGQDAGDLPDGGQ